MGPNRVLSRTAQAGLVMVLAVIMFVACGAEDAPEVRSEATETQGALTTIGEPASTPSGFRDELVAVVAQYLEVPGWAECTVDRLLSREDPELDEFPPVEEVVDLSLPYSEQPDLDAQANLVGVLCSIDASDAVAAKIEDEAAQAGVATETVACVRLELMEWRPGGGYLPDAVVIDETGELPPEMATALPGAIDRCETGESPWVTYEPEADVDQPATPGTP